MICYVRRGLGEACAFFSVLMMSERIYRQAEWLVSLVIMGVVNKQMSSLCDHKERHFCACVCSCHVDRSDSKICTYEQASIQGMGIRLSGRLNYVPAENTLHLVVVDWWGITKSARPQLRPSLLRCR